MRLKKETQGLGLRKDWEYNWSGSFILSFWRGVLGKCGSRSNVDTANHLHKVVEIEQVQEKFHHKLSTSSQRYQQVVVEIKWPVVSLTRGLYRKEKDHPHGQRIVWVRGPIQRYFQSMSVKYKPRRMILNRVKNVTLTLEKLVARNEPW